MMKYLLIILMLLPLTYAISFSEIYANPIGGEEWIELYTDEAFHFVNISLSDNKNTDIIGCCVANCSLQLPKKSYIVIGETGSLIADYCVDDASIGNGLGNTEDSLAIYQNQELLDQYSYTKTMKGQSLSVVNNTWYITNPTPGTPNQKPNQFKITSVLPNQAFANTPYKLFKIENLFYETGDEAIEIKVYYNISQNNSVIDQFTKEGSVKKYTTSLISYTFEHPGEYVICAYVDVSFCANVTVKDSAAINCNVSINVSTDALWYQEGDKVSITLDISNNSFPYSISYWVEDLFNRGYKKPYSTANTNKKSFTPKIDETDKILFVKASLESIACNNQATNTTAKTMILIQGNSDVRLDQNEPGSSSRIIVEKIDDPVYVSEPLLVNTKITRASTQKYVVEAYVKGNQKISKTTKVHIKNDVDDLSISIPIVFLPKCSLEEGNYDLVVEGLGAHDDQKIKIINDITCEQKEQNTITSSTAKQYTLDNIHQTNESVITLLTITNTDAITHNYTVWSYLYQGRNALGERHQNQQLISLQANDQKQVLLINSIESATTGNYSYKISILRDDRKTAYEFKDSIMITKPGQANQQQFTSNSLSKTANPEEIIANKTIFNNNISSRITGDVIYASPQSKMKKYSSVLIVVVLFMTIVGLKKLS